MSCKKCKETNALMSACKIKGNREYFATLRYDFDCEDRNEMDIEIGYTINDANAGPETYGIWSRSFITNYCPFCGRKLDNQTDISYDDLEYDNTGRYILISDLYIFKENNVEVTLYLNLKEKRLELELSIDNKIYNVSYACIEYSPIDGTKLIEYNVKDNDNDEIAGCIIDTVEDLITANIDDFSNNRDDVFIRGNLYDELASKIKNILNESNLEENKYEYFVVYQYIRNGNDTGIGNLTVSRKNKINSFDDLEQMKNDIEKKTNADIAILNYKLMNE